MSDAVTVDENVQRIIPVTHAVEIEIGFPVAECFSDETNVARVVLDQ